MAQPWPVNAAAARVSVSANSPAQPACHAPTATATAVVAGPHAASPGRWQPSWMHPEQLAAVSPGGPRHAAVVGECDMQQVEGSPLGLVQPAVAAAAAGGGMRRRGSSLAGRNGTAARDTLLLLGVQLLPGLCWGHAFAETQPTSMPSWGVGPKIHLTNCRCSPPAIPACPNAEIRMLAFAAVCSKICSRHKSKIPSTLWAPPDH